MWPRLKSILLDRNRREALSLVGGALAAVVGATWIVFQYFDRSGDESAQPSTAIENSECVQYFGGPVTVDGGDIANTCPSNDD